MFGDPVKGFLDAGELVLGGFVPLDELGGAVALAFKQSAYEVAAAGAKQSRSDAAEAQNREW